MYSKESVQRLVKQSESLKELHEAVGHFKFYLMDYGVIDEDSLIGNMELDKLTYAFNKAGDVLKGLTDDKAN